MLLAGKTFAQRLPNEFGLSHRPGLRLPLSKFRQREELTELHAASRPDPQPVRIAVGDCVGIDLFRGGYQFRTRNRRRGQLCVRCK